MSDLLGEDEKIISNILLEVNKKPAKGGLG